MLFQILLLNMTNKFLNVIRENYILIGLSLLLILIKFLFVKENVLTWDVFGYYLYLPAKFIYNDLALTDQNWVATILETYDSSSTLYQAVHLENGNWVIKYTLGLSILLAPFFFVAHLIAEPLGFTPDGFSEPYQYLMLIGGICYAIIGLVYTNKVLRYFFTVKVATSVLLLIFLGTNYLQLTAFDGTLLSHNFLFTLYAVLIYYTIKWYDKPSYLSVILIGVSIGFIVLIRPSEIVSIFIPLLWYHKTKGYFKEKYALIKSNLGHIILISVLVFGIFFFQMIYWKMITGDYLYYSYTNAGEGLDFLAPHTYNFLFSFRKGWLVYTPLVVFAIWGLVRMIQNRKWMYVSIITFVVLDVYIASSWTTWWYAGGSFSSRSMEPAYALLAIPLGFLIKDWRIWSDAKRIIIGTLLGLLVILNVFQTWQFNEGILSKQRMTMAYYFRIFGKMEVSEEDKKLLLVKRSTETVEVFSNSNNYISRVVFDGDFSLKEYEDIATDGAIVLSDSRLYSPGIDLKFDEITENDHAWIVAEAEVFLPLDYSGNYPELVATFHHQGKAYKYRTRALNVNAVTLGEWNNVKIEYMTPEVRSTSDNLKVYLWHRGEKDIKIRKLNIRVFEKK
jgi:hypothetical protein